MEQQVKDPALTALAGVIAVALVQSLARELPYAVNAAKKKKKGEMTLSKHYYPTAILKNH